MGLGLSLKPGRVEFWVEFEAWLVALSLPWLQQVNEDQAVPAAERAEMLKRIEIQEV